MWLWVATEPASQDGETAIILGVIGALSLVLVAAVTGFFSLLSAKQNRTTPAAPPSPAPPTDSDGIGRLRERVAVLERRADDSDERDEVQDRRLDQHERVLDIDNAEWRHDGH